VSLSALDLGAKLTQTGDLLTSLCPSPSKRVFNACEFAPKSTLLDAPSLDHPNLAAVRIHRGLPHFPPGQRRIVTTGTFDGVHLGHRALLDWMVQKAREEESETVVLTFDPHPRQVLFGDASGLELIQSMGQRAACLAQTGLDHLVIQPFDRAFSRLKPEEFVRDVLVEGLGTTTIVVGHDHRFGAGREGDVELLRACGETFGFNVQHIPAHIEGELTVSSTKVRQRLRDGDLTAAHALLGRRHAWRGEVVAGDGRGRTLGFRTANLAATEPHQLLPAEGVYAAKVVLVSDEERSENNAPAPQTWGGMVNIGPRPTFDSPTGKPTVEVHLFTAESPNLYGTELEVVFVERMRDIQKFDGPQALIGQLKSDAENAQRILGQEGSHGLR